MHARQTVLYVITLFSLLNTGLQEPAQPPPREQPASEASEKAPSEEVSPVSPMETVVVTAARREEVLESSVSMVSLLSREDLDRSATLTLDDELRQIPGFSLFRLSGSLSSHPTTQGLSLRGIGPSGASRTLVLFDEIPLNDPFGGWVYWNRIPPLALEQVEIVRGATSSLYGSSALGGTLQLRTRTAAPRRFEMSGELGGHQVRDLQVLTSDKDADWAYLVAGRVFDTDGFYIVSEEERGSVDTPADLSFQTLLSRAEYKRAYASINLYRESRNNGTELQRNNSRLVLLDGGVSGETWKFRLYSQFQELNSSFSRVSPDRSEEILTAEQHFPSSAYGTSLVWYPTGQLLLGTDWRQARWQGKVQNLSGFFAQYLQPIHPRLDVLMGGRFDLWNNQTTQTSFNPRAGLLLRGTSFLTLRASAYRGFRAPTLNELYRPFQVGNIFTEANPDLREEHLWGTEGGLDFHPGPRLLVRLNGFWNSLQDPVSNVTVSVSPNFIRRQRQNLGSGTIKGGEAVFSYRFAPDWAARASYLYSQATVDHEGLLFPQVPRHQGWAGLGYFGAVAVEIEGRAFSKQFEDDQNQLLLPGHVLANLRVSHPLNDQLELFLSVENLFDTSYAVGRLPVPRLGTPRLIHGGIRLRLSY